MFCLYYSYTDYGAQISCFRDDVMFFVYLWQRYLYPVDARRSIEVGGMDDVLAAATNVV